MNMSTIFWVVIRLVQHAHCGYAVETLLKMIYSRTLVTMALDVTSMDVKAVVFCAR